MNRRAASSDSTSTTSATTSATVTTSHADGEGKKNEMCGPLRAVCALTAVRCSLLTRAVMLLVMLTLCVVALPLGVYFVAQLLVADSSERTPPLAQPLPLTAFGDLLVCPQRP